ncbi:hypothetical protein A9P82_07345 [Arachidicoccus ginsenosidimutans]|uniref:hypothetical protein n=1 Tax=Arachidicoccus sp. BS20 TaxID=1850526 RepID=UPI0007F15618|nr:hypothetical protein [Arachidicoccus sp. BS20]ANI89120.1 hypothetical protein A9P82_07345 [Arachidicoccus sp. BS20]
MKHKILGIGVLSLLMGSCTVVYQGVPGQDGVAINTPQQSQQYGYGQQQYSDNESNDGYSDDWDADTSASAEPKIDFNSGAYDDGYVYDPAYFNSNFYAGNPFWGLGIYAGWGWDPWFGGGFYPWGWGIGVGYGWGGYYGWGSIYSGWGGYYGWGYPYYGWGGYYGGGHHWGYAPYVVNRHVNFQRRGGTTATGASLARSGRSYAVNNRDFNISNTRGQRAYNPTSRSNSFGLANRNYSYGNSRVRSYTAPNRSYSTQSSSNNYYSTPSRSYSVPSRTYSAPSRSYSAPSRSYSAPSRSYSAPSRSYGGGGRSSGGRR